MVGNNHWKEEVGTHVLFGNIQYEDTAIEP